MGTLSGEGLNMGKLGQWWERQMMAYDAGRFGPARFDERLLRPNNTM